MIGGDLDMEGASCGCIIEGRPNIAMHIEKTARRTGNGRLCMRTEGLLGMIHAKTTLTGVVRIRIRIMIMRS